MLRAIFKLLIGRRKRGRRRASPLYSLGFKLGVGAIAVTLGMLLAFSVFDSFSYYYWYWFSEDSDREFRDGQSATMPTDYAGWFSDSFDKEPVNPSGGTVPTPSTTPGYTGITGMYINNLGAGYIAEMLGIVKDHCNWSAMHPECTDNEWKQDDGSILYLYPRISSVLGGLLAESGVTSEGLLKTILLAEGWASNENMTLSNFNSHYMVDNPTVSIASDIDRTTLKKGGYYTHWQFGRGYMYRWPNGVNDARGNHYPSAMSGYKLNGALRERADTDAAYFPDQVSVYIQNTFGQIWNFCEESLLDQDDIAAASYPIWNGGVTRIQYTWASGGHYHNGGKFPWLFSVETGATPVMPESNPKQSILASAAINKVSDAILECLEFLYDHPDLLENATGGWAEHNLYSGMAITAMLLDGGFIASDYCLADLQGKISDTETPFMKGAWIAYLAHTCSETVLHEGETVESIATVKDVADYLRSITLTTVDEDFYGAPYMGKGAVNDDGTLDYDNDLREVVVHMYNPNYQVKNGAGVGPRDVLHAFNEESLRGAFMSVIGGTYAYWHLLIVAGVEATVEQVANDASGLKVPDLSEVVTDPETGEILDISSDSYYYGTKAFSSFLYNQVGYSKVTSPLYYRDLVGLRNSVGMHVGEDYATSLGNGTYGQDLAAIADSKVVSIGTESGYGRTIVFEIVEPRSAGTTKTMRYRYAHMYSFAEGLEKGSFVKQGEFVGVSGGSGTDDLGNLDIEHYSVHLHLTFTVQEKSSSGNYAWFVVPIGGVFQGHCTVASAPRVAKVIKKCNPGDCTVYDCYMNPKGCLIEKQIAVYGEGPMNDGWWLTPGYYGVGAWLNLSG